VPHIKRAKKQKNVVKTNSTGRMNEVNVFGKEKEREKSE
jgi:hypothetical protein